MPGYTIDQLAVLGRDPQDYRWCPGCNLWWHKCGIKLHQAAEDRREAERAVRPSRQPAKRKWQRVRAKDLTVKSDLKVPNEIYPWERVLLAPFVGEIITRVIDDAAREVDTSDSE